MQAYELPLAKGVEMSPKLALQQLAGLARILEDPARSPLIFRGDNLKHALQDWATNGELSSITSLTGPEGYPISLEMRGLITLYSLANLQARMQSCKLEDLAQTSPDFEGVPTCPEDIIKKMVELIHQQSDVRLSEDGPNLVVYPCPRFVSMDRLGQIGNLANRLVIDPQLESPQYGFGYKHSEEAMRELSHGFSSRLITLEFDGKIHGFYFMHLLFPQEPTGSVLDNAKQRAYELNLLEAPTERSTEFYHATKSMTRHWNDFSFNYSRRAAWADLVAISSQARNYYRERGQHAYTEIHSTMLEMCQLFGIERVFGEVRIGKNENLAWQSHQKLGWKMPEEDKQRSKPMYRNGNEYALIYLDVEQLGL